MLKRIEIRFIRTNWPVFDWLGEDPVPIIPDVLPGDKILPERRAFSHSGIAPDRTIRFHESLYSPFQKILFKSKSPSERSVGRDSPSAVTKHDKRFTARKPFFTSSLSENSDAERSSFPWAAPQRHFLKT